MKLQPEDSELSLAQTLKDGETTSQQNSGQKLSPANKLCKQNHKLTFFLVWLLDGLKITCSLVYNKNDC